MPFISSVLRARAGLAMFAVAGAASLALGFAPVAHADVPVAAVTATVSTSTSPATLTVSAVFSGAIPMASTTTVPTISFSQNIYGDLATTSAAWTAADTYTEVYNISDGVSRTGVTATVSGAQNINGEVAVSNLTSNSFSYNTISWTITASAGANGTISPTGSVSVPDTNSKTFTFTPSSGYLVSGITIDGGSSIPTTATSYTFPNVSANHTIAVTFAPFGSVSSSPVLVNLSTNNVLTVSATYSQAMSSTTLNVSLGINGTPLANGNLVPLSASWNTGTTTYTATFSAAAGLSLSNVVATISGATDSFGNSAGTLTSNAFSIDTVVPNASVTGPSSIVNIASSTVSVITDFDKAMASTTLTTKFVDSLGGDITSSFTSVSAGWVTTMRYLATYTAGSNVNQSGIRAVTSGASDTNSNAAATATSSPFTVDTAAPSGSAATGTALVNINNNSITVTTTFTKPMASTTIAVAFASGATNVTGDFTGAGAGWTSSTTYAAVFTAQPNVYQTNVIATVSGATDTSGNSAASATTTAFTLDTVAPTGSASTPSSSSIVNVVNDTVTLTTVFSKEMASSTLTVAFTNATSSADISSAFSFLSGTWNTGTTTYTAAYRAAVDTHQPAVIATISGGLDTDGNSAAATSTASFAVDTVAPSGSISLPTASALFNISASTITVDTSFTKSMASSTLAINFSPAGIAPFLSTTTAYWVDSQNYTASFSVLAGYENTSVTATVSGAVDTSGNSASATTTPAFTVDTLAPSFSLASPTSFATVNVASSTFTITGNFSKPMASTTLSVQFLSATSSDITALFTPVSAGWTTTSAYSAVFTAVSGIFQTGITAVVSGATDTHNNSAPATSTPSFIVDTLAPSASVVSAMPLVNVVNNTATVTVDFSKTMNATIAPTITFTTNGQDVSSNFVATSTPLASRWSNATTTYSLLYTVAAPFATTTVVATVSGAEDTNQNVAPASVSAAFDVDTVAPSGSVTSPTVASVFNTTGNTISFVALFDKTMASTSLQIAFSPTSIYGYLATTTEGWTNSTTYAASYTVAPSFNNSGVTITLSGAQDTNQNVAPATTTAAFVVDTLVPTASVITPTGSTFVNVANNVLTVATLFDKSMASTSLTFSFADNMNANVTNEFAQLSAGWTNATTYNATFTSTPGYTGSGVTVGVSGAMDTHNNVALTATSSAFTVDTIAPVGTITNPTATIEVNRTNNSFTIVVSYSKNMDTNITPTIEFSPLVSSADVVLQSGAWTSGTTYSATYKVVNSLSRNVIATVSGAKDTADNSAAAVSTSPIAIHTSGSVVIFSGFGGGGHNPLPGEVITVPAPVVPVPVVPVPVVPQPVVRPVVPVPVVSAPVAANTPSPIYVPIGAKAPVVALNGANGRTLPVTDTASVRRAQSAAAIEAVTAKVSNFFKGVFGLFRRG